MSARPVSTSAVDELMAQHWLKFRGFDGFDGGIVGCQCGFRADMDADCGYGDSVVRHLFEVARPVVSSPSRDQSSSAGASAGALAAAVAERDELERANAALALRFAATAVERDVLVERLAAVEAAVDALALNDHLFVLPSEHHGCEREVCRLVVEAFRRVLAVGSDDAAVSHG